MMPRYEIILAIFASPSPKHTGWAPGLTLRADCASATDSSAAAIGKIHDRFGRTACGRYEKLSITAIMHRARLCAVARRGYCEQAAERLLAAHNYSVPRN